MYVRGASGHLVTTDVRARPRNPRLPGDCDFLRAFRFALGRLPKRRVRECPPFAELPVCWIVKRPVAAPCHVDAEASGNFFADMPYQGPFRFGQIPRLDGVDYVNGTTIVVSGLTRFGLCDALHIQGVLLLRCPQDAMGEHRHTEFRHSLDQRPLKIEDVRQRPFTVRPCLLFMPLRAFQKGEIAEGF